jgi:peroxiredoxin
MAKYQETSGQFNSNNTVILGMSVDSTWANAAFADKLGVKFNILSDASRDISRSYGVFEEKGLVARRTAFVIDSGSCRRCSWRRKRWTRRTRWRPARC